MNLLEFVEAWVNPPSGSGRRNNLKETDDIWGTVYKNLVDNSQNFLEKVYVEPGTTLFRVHQVPSNLPKREEFDDAEGYEYELAAVKAKNSSISAQVEFNNHWVSFTDDPKVITEPYLLGKGLTGDVVVLKSDKAIRLTPVGGRDFEKEVVAPLDKNNVIEVLDN